MAPLEPHFGGRIATTAEQSEPWWPAVAPAMSSQPNVLQIVFDDTGWADFGCFGSEIDTPNIDALAAEGLRYTQFHVTPLCSPTRASLFTARNHHRVGMRFLADIDTGFPNSRGHIAPDVRTVPDEVRAAGYGTYLVGKWHLTPQHEVTPAGPFHNWPLARGFDRFYGFLDGCTDQYDPELFEDNHFAPAPIGPDGDLTSTLVDRAITYLSDHELYRPQAPFFMNFAPGATHAPLQAPAHLIDKYAGVFEKGWDNVRATRLARQVAMGLVPADTELTPRNPGVPAWADLSRDEQRLFVRLQAVYAAFLEHADTQIGRLLDHLTAMGRRRDTLIAVLSDNGASREGGRLGAVDVNAAYSGVRQSIAEQIGRIDLIGGPDGPAHYPDGWAMAGNTPFRRYKQSVDLGGVRSPLVLSWPGGLGSEAGGIRTQFAHVIDLAATVLDVSGAPGGMAIDGASLRHTFAQADAPPPRATQYWEMFGHRAIWHDGWKAVTEHQSGTPYEDDVWRLYDTRSDFAEARDLAPHHPEKLDQLIAAWWREARRNEVLPLDDRSLVELLNTTRTPLQLASRSRLRLLPGISHVPVTTGVTSLARPLRISATITGRGPGDDGQIVTSGTARGGFCLALEGHRLRLTHIALGRTLVIEGEVGYGDFTVTLAAARRGEAGHVRLYRDGDLLVAGEVPLVIAHPSFRGLETGPEARPFLAGMTGLRRGVVAGLQMEFLEGITSEQMADLLAKGD